MTVQALDETPAAPLILVIGTGDTKADEIQFLANTITKANAVPLLMDVSVLGDPPYIPDFSKHDVAAAAGHTLEHILESPDENVAMTLMAEGASALALSLYDAGQIHGFIALGGTMGTDLALDVALALPLGVPKFVVSTIAYSHLLPPSRIATDLMMILWAGGLFGLNAICRSVLSQAAGAVVGAARATQIPRPVKPLIGMSSLGKSCLRYMEDLKPEIEKRGYELVVFHTTGMGGRALEAIAAKEGFAAVLDFSLQELANDYNGSVVSSGPDRLENAGRARVPQIIAPGAIDMIDLPAWKAIPAHLSDRTYYAHNRLIGMVTASADRRREIARYIGGKISRHSGPVAFVLPERGIQQWDQPGEPFHDAAALTAFIDEMKRAVPPNAELHVIDAHINDRAFVDRVLRILDNWIEMGVVRPGVIPPPSGGEC